MYETRLPSIGIRYGTCGGSPFFGGIDVDLEVHITERYFDNNTLESIRTKASWVTHVPEDEVGSRLPSGERSGPDSLQSPRTNGN